MKAAAITLTALLMSAGAHAALKNAVYICKSKGAVQVDDEGKLGKPIAVDEVKFNFELATGTYYAGEKQEKFQVLPRGKNPDAPIIAVERDDKGGLDLLSIDWAVKQGTPAIFALFSVGGAFFAGTCEEKLK